MKFSGLTTERLLLRDFTQADLQEIAATVGDDRITTWLSFDSRSIAEAEIMLSGILERQKMNPRTEYYLAITPLDSSQKVIGFVRLGINGSAADLGYALRPEFQGKGYAREAAIMMLRYGFGDLGLHRISAAIGPDNNASIRLIRAIGFTHEGVIRDHVFTNGAWRNSETFSLLEHEWTARKCARCDSPVAPTRRGGRERQFCSAACRQSAYRARLAV